MKKIILGLGFCLAVAFTASAQRYAIIDTKYILDKMPDYKQAQKTIDATAPNKKERKMLKNITSQSFSQNLRYEVR